MNAGVAICIGADHCRRRADEAVVISSYAAEAQIARNLADCGIPAERIVRLYD